MAKTIHTITAIMATIMARKRKTIALRSRAPAKRHLAPRAGRPNEEKRSRAKTRNAVIPGRPAGPDPESIATNGEYGFRVRRSAAPRNDANVVASGDDVTAAALHRLMAWLSPSYPVGAFSYSSGIEWAVEAGDIGNADAARRWLGSMLTSGAGFCDAIFFTHAHRAVAAEDDTALRNIAELAAAFAPSKERHLETTAQGRAFVEVTRAAWRCAALDRFVKIWDGAIAYPVALGVAVAGHGIPAETALRVYLHAMTANWISACVRLIPLGQTDGQRILAALEGAIAQTAHRALSSSLDDLGSATFRADLASMKHETQYTRLFRS